MPKLLPLLFSFLALFPLPLMEKPTPTAGSTPQGKPSPSRIVSQILPPKDFSSIFILNEDGTKGGSACPVGLGALAYTAKHVVVDTHPTKWFDPITGRTGLLKIDLVSPDRDLARVSPVGGEEQEFFPHPLPVAKDPPLSGDPLIADGMIRLVPVRFKGNVLMINPELNDLWVDAMTYSGSSGGCVTSPLPKVEVYGIVLGSAFETEMPTAFRPVLRIEPIWGLKK